MTRGIAIAVAWVTIGSSLALAQGLADVAKAEEARRKTVQQASKVYTNNDLQTDFTTAPGQPPAADPASLTGGTETAAPGTPAATSPPATPAGAVAPATAPPAPMRDQAYWSARMTAARTQLERSRIFAESLQSRINALTTDFVNRDDPAQRSVIEQDRTRATAELDRVKKEIDDQTKAIAAIEDEARRAGVPPGWLR